MEPSGGIFPILFLGSLVYQIIKAITNKLKRNKYQETY